MSNKFNIFHRPMNTALLNTITIVKACCVLHNFIRERDGYRVEDTLTVEGFQELQLNMNNNIVRTGDMIRDKFANYFVSPDGSVSWQDATSKILQSPGANIGKAVDLIQNTIENMGKIRDSFNILIEEANCKALQWDVTPEFSCKRRGNQDQRLSQGNHYFKTQVLYRCIDTVVTQLKTRFVGLSEINDLFSCILLLTVISDDKISESTKNLVDEFQDLNPAELATQIDFPELLTAFYLFLALPITVVSSERTFLKLKLIINYLRNTMSQARLSGLAMISIENDRAKKINLSSLYYFALNLLLDIYFKAIVS
ncbi:hypothetical protein AGLY_013925 [Aphis glycines]|uniref:HAT C-terminal dimerisation domain-containing protein n=1 Tax=Aphis glycines TaxID=307491 RepID=A0A6G0T537_APHGL|nr:hypothetical protein AGLY_013925 [Aphis glycines]